MLATGEENVVDESEIENDMIADWKVDGEVEDD